VHALRPFGADPRQNMVFVKHQACITRCDAWVYLTAIQFARPAGDNLYQFKWDDKGFVETRLDYQLPDMAREARVELRVPPTHDAQGPHLVQRYSFADGKKDEWLVFSCRSMKCDHTMYEGELPAPYRNAWQAGSRL